MKHNTAMGYQPLERIDEVLPDGEVLGIVRMRKISQDFHILPAISQS